MKILISAYACEPGQGSEPGIGWHCVAEAARNGHEVWVLTRANNRGPIEAELRRAPIPGLNFAYCDLPAWARWWKRGGRGVQLYYYLWQIIILFAAQRLHRQHQFDLVQHITFNRYWMPSFLSLIGAPFIWGPVGGGERAPRCFLSGMTLRGQIYETVRGLARWLGERDPFVRMTARRCALALGTTRESAARIKSIGARRTDTFLAVALPEHDLERLSRIGDRGGRPLRFASIGRLLEWKGFHLGLRAFARAGIPGAEYWIVGDGPARASLERMARALGVAESVRFHGALSREETLARLAECDVLVHPSLHDSGGWVCMEALAAGRPVICLDIGGPAVQVGDGVGFRIAADTPEQAERDIATAMRGLAEDGDMLARMSGAARRWAAENFSWRSRGQRLNEIYLSVAGGTHG